MEKQYGICYTYSEGGNSMEWFASDEFDCWVFTLNNYINAEGICKVWELERVDGTVAFLKEC